MCLILFAHKAHPEYKLVIAANRDEFYKRPTAPADFWEESPEILAGRDLTAGGTWMGISTEGRISMLTNYRDLSNIKPDAPSRGHLVSDFLQEGGTAEEYLRQVAHDGDQYNGFNIICGSPDELYYYGNYGTQVEEVTPGYHGLSNALLDTNWPKVDRGVAKLKQVISTSFSVEDLFEVLHDDIKAPDELLPDTGVGIDKERMLSPMFIKSPDYGSRCSTVILIDQRNHVTFVERTYNVIDNTYSDKKFQFQL